MTRSIRRTISVLACTTFLPLLIMGCPKKEPVVEDAGPPPPVPVPSATVTELAPLATDDAGPDAEVDAGKKPYTGPTYNPNQMKVKACCNALRAQAKQLGSSPEGFQMMSMATTCDTLATQIGPQGNAPELAQLRQILKSVNLPAVCTGM
jgi:hypothetical protein